MKGQIAIIGAGNIGKAIEYMIRDSGRNILFFDKDESRMPTPLPLEKIVGEAEIVFLCVNSWAARAALTDALPYLLPSAIVVSPIKGIEDETLLTVDEIMRDVLSNEQSIALLNGPMLSAEMLDDHPAFAALAAADEKVRKQLEELFAGTEMHVRSTSDVHGVALSGVLKNVYSIGLGMTEAIKAGSNFRGWFVQQATEEMADILEKLGGKRETAYGPAGLGDLVATGFSPHSRNCKAGQEVVTSGECITISEGHMSLPQLLQLLEDDTSSLPLLHLIKSVLIDKQDAKEAFGQVL